jgi:hypothetical protein
MQHNISSYRIKNATNRITSLSSRMRFYKKSAKNDFQKDNGVKISKWCIKFADADL